MMDLKPKSYSGKKRKVKKKKKNKVNKVWNFDEKSFGEWGLL